MSPVEEALRLAQFRREMQNGTARSVRVDAGLSLAEVAAATGVDASTVWRWEQCRRVPRGAAALRYAALLDLLAGARAQRVPA